jgi:hypothetical protein
MNRIKCTYRKRRPVQAETCHMSYASVTIANCENGQHDDPHRHCCCSPRSDCTDLINSVRIRYNCTILFWICLSLLLALGFACRCCSPRSDSPRHGSHQQHQACQFPYVSGTQYNCTILFWICLSLLLALGFACRCCSPRSDSPRHGSHQQHQACQLPYVSGTQYNCTMSSLQFI